MDVEITKPQKGFTVSRDGSILGNWSEAELKLRLRMGVFLSTDLAWTEDAPIWVPLRTLFPEDLSPDAHLSRKQRLEKKQNETISNVQGILGLTFLLFIGAAFFFGVKALWFLLLPTIALIFCPETAEQKKTRMQKEAAANVSKPAEKKEAWRDNPITPRQISFLRKLGALPAGQELNRGEASDLIDNALNEQTNAHPSYSFKLEAEEARKDIERIRQAAIDEFYTKAEQREDLAIAREELRDAEKSRLNFWAATCDKNWMIKERYEDLWNVESAIERLHKQHGRNHERPTNTIISVILTELDSDDPEWDKNTPARFFNRLNRKQ